MKQIADYFKKKKVRVTAIHNLVFSFSHTNINTYIHSPDTYTQPHIHQHVASGLLGTFRHFKHEYNISHFDFSFILLSPFSQFSFVAFVSVIFTHQHHRFQSHDRVFFSTPSSPFQF